MKWSLFAKNLNSIEIIVLIEIRITYTYQQNYQQFIVVIWKPAHYRRLGFSFSFFFDCITLSAAKSSFV